VADDGVGIPEGMDFKNTESLGLQIVQTLTLQLKGSLGVENIKGTKFKLVFPE
jgi:two-component sensor histidine kinase